MVTGWFEWLPRRFHWGAERAIRRIRETPLRRFLAPGLREISQYVESQSTDTQRLLHSVLGTSLLELAQLTSEFLEAFPGSQVSFKNSHAALSYPAEFQFSPDLSLPLYQLVRILKPRSVVETGVADGRSSWIILEGLRRNGAGSLTSLDISETAGRLVPDDLRARWTLRVLPLLGTARAFKNAIESAGTIDLFLHDSDHRYSWQLFEFRTVWQFLVTGGVLLSDDIDASFAFTDFGRGHGKVRAALVGGNKVAGLILK